MVDRFFLSVLWIFLPTIFWPPEFLKRSRLLTLWGFPCKWWDIFLLLLSIFSPCNWLSAFSLWCVWMWIFLYLSYLGFFIFLDSSNFGKCSPLLLWIFFCPFLSCPFLLDSQYAYVGALNAILHFPTFVFIFLHYCSLFFILHNICWSTFKSTDSFFCQIKSVHPLQWDFHCSYHTFNFRISTGFLNNLYHSIWILYVMRQSHHILLYFF